MFTLGLLVSPMIRKNIKQKQKIVFKDRVVEHVRTEIVESPDGSKKTIIIENKKRDVSKVSEKIVYKQDDWIASISSSVGSGKPRYSLGVQRRVLGDLFIGGYYKTDSSLINDSEFGVTLSLTF